MKISRANNRMTDAGSIFQNDTPLICIKHPNSCLTTGVGFGKESTLAGKVSTKEHHKQNDNENIFYWGIKDSTLHIMHAAGCEEAAGARRKIFTGTTKQLIQYMRNSELVLCSACWALAKTVPCYWCSNLSTRVISGMPFCNKCAEKWENDIPPY